MTTIEMNQNCGLDITVIIDRSGSMGSVRDDAIGAFNTFLSDRQKSDPDALMTMVQFDHEYEVLVNGVPIQVVRPLGRETYVPRGNTALLDAVGKTVGSIESRTHTANAILVAILTDGQENASVEWHAGQVRDLIQEREAKGWDFYYLSAELSAFNDGRAIGIDPRKISQFRKECMNEAYEKIDDALLEKKKFLMEQERKRAAEDKMYR
ncbi:MAG: vWA domain-containing protein [Methanomicrobiales archaeon]